MNGDECDGIPLTHLCEQIGKKAGGGPRQRHSFAVAETDAQLTVWPGTG
jgi:hypothetical protein